jgi:general secretion pathway protein G
MKRRVRFVSLLVLTSVLVSGCSTRSERERILKQDLMVMRQAIDNYTLDKEQAPQSLQELVNGHFLKEIPIDPFTRKKDWALLVDRVVLTNEQSSTGIVDVHSASGQDGSNGRAYNEW